MTIQFLLMSPDRREIFLCAPSLLFTTTHGMNQRKLPQSEIQGGVDKSKGSVGKTTPMDLVDTARFFKDTRHSMA